MSETVDAIAALGRLPGVAEQVEAARDACTELRWHEALRRRVPEAAAESRVRGAWASGDLKGARSQVDRVRDVMRGAATWGDPPDPVERVMRGAVAATAETERLDQLLLRAPMQAIARLHTAAMAGILEADQLGRPRGAVEECRELVDVGLPPRAAEARARLTALGDLLVGGRDLPALLVVAVAHAEIATSRPFVGGNGIVARAVERIAVRALGLDPTGVAVPEAGHRALGATAYHGALAAYESGTAQGMTLWVRHCSEAIRAAVREGVDIADAVRRGRLG